jgi:hypothetical protein
MSGCITVAATQDYSTGRQGDTMISVNISRFNQAVQLIKTHEMFPAKKKKT